MKTTFRPSPSDEEINRLLRRSYRDTSPEFEARWVALKREIRQQPRSRPFWSAPWAGWLGLLGAAAVLAFVVHIRHTPAPAIETRPELSPQLIELFSMDSVLNQATPLLDEGNREALLNLPAATHS